MTEFANKTIKYKFITCFLASQYKNDKHLNDLKDAFIREKCVKLPNLFNPETFKLLQQEMLRLQQFAESKKFVMGGYNTPRQMSLLGATKLLQESSIIWAVYLHGEIWSLIQTITGSRIYPSVHPDGFMGANYLLNVGETQGWHLDDDAYTVVYAFKSLPKGRGGTAEFIKDWLQHCEKAGVNPRENVDEFVEDMRKAGQVSSVYLAPGDAYLMKADECLHRVTPIQEEGQQRIVLAVGYMDREIVASTYDHTYSDLYGHS